MNITSPTSTTPEVLKTFGTVPIAIAFDYSTSNEDGTNNSMAEVRTASGIVVASNSKSLPNTESGSNFIDVSIPQGTANGSYTVVLTVEHFNPSGNLTDSKTDTEVGAIVVAVNPPVLGFIPAKTVDEQTALTFQAVLPTLTCPTTR